MDKSHHTSAPSPGYETRDANVHGVYKFLVFLSVLLVLSALVSWGLFRYFSKQDENSAAASPFAETRQLPLGPQLQVNPREDWLKYHDEQVHALENYSWENRAAGIVRVPVELAMELQLKKGLPVQNSAAVPVDAVSGEAPRPQAKKSAPKAERKP